MGWSQTGNGLWANGRGYITQSTVFIAHYDSHPDPWFTTLEQAQEWCEQQEIERAENQAGINEEDVDERMRCIHVLERRMLKLWHNLHYTVSFPEQRKEWEAQHKALSAAADEMRTMEFERSRIVSSDC